MQARGRQVYAVCASVTARACTTSRLLLFRDDLVLDIVVDVLRYDFLFHQLVLALVGPAFDDRRRAYRSDAFERLQLLFRCGVDVDEFSRLGRGWSAAGRRGFAAGRCCRRYCAL